MPEVRQVLEIKLPEPAVEAPAPVAAPEISAPRPDPVPAATPDPAPAAFSETVSAPPPAVPRDAGPDCAPHPGRAGAQPERCATAAASAPPVLTAGVTRAPPVAAEDEDDRCWPSAGGSPAGGRSRR